MRDSPRSDTTLPSPAGQPARRSLSGLLPFMRPYRGRIAWAGVFLIGAAVTTLLFPIALRQLIDGSLSGDPQALGQALLGQHFALLFGIAAALGLFSALRFYMVSWLGERVMTDLRQAVYSHVLRQSPAFFETTQTGEVLSRLGTDTTLVQTLVGSSLSMGLRNLVMGTGALAMLVWSHPYVMLQVVAVVLGVVLPTLWFGRRVRRLSRASQDRMADSSAIAAEVLNAMPVVQSHSAEQHEARRFADANQRAFSSAVRRSRARAVLVAFIIIANAAFLLWGMYQGTQAVLAGQMTAGQLGQAVVYVILLASAVAILGEVYGDWLRAAGATERLMELLHHESPVRSPAQPRALPEVAAGSTVRFEAIDFRYPSRPQHPSLQGFELDVASGQTVALVGPSGAGKSTVLSLLLRFYDPQAGRILLDGVPIDEVDLQRLRDRIAIVPQEPVIFSSSALENIRYGRRDASDEEVVAAARAAHADGFIRQLPEGYATFLGERGVRLSGGQRQRIAIARAMLKNAPLLLLDEATSALDAQSEQAVQAALEAAMAGRTTLVIAHRLATVQRADRIVVLDHGRVVEQGSHAELVALGGLYAGLAALQFNS
ncbi:ABC transporter transmembrane domain-containing protein [Hydrogenophaga sp. OTU3427]|uniref:ABC transporter transmembrane domain-containing protein n=1 Tax=Hydrogenophaga sp. OTU3427 TaxID=3043856 RepID=UPI00313EAD11